MAAVKFSIDYASKPADVLDQAGIRRRVEARLGVFGSGRHELVGERVVLEQDMATPAVLATIAKRGLRPATYFELASAAVVEPTLGTKSALVALGSCDVNFVGGSASPAIASFEGERIVTMAGFLGAWPAGTELFAIPKDLEAGHGTVSHNHLFPIEQKRSPKLVFAQPPCAVTFAEVAFDAALDLRAAAKKAKLRNVADLIDDTERFPRSNDATGGKATLAMEIITCNRMMRSIEAVAELAARKLRPATIRELVALVTAQPDVLDTRSIWALADVACAGVYKASGRTLGVHVGMDNGEDPQSPVADARWPFWTWFAGVRRG